MRKKGSNGQRLDSVEKDILLIQKELEEKQKNFEEHLRTHIIEDLQKERFSGSGKYMYSYKDIAEKYNVSFGFVQRTAIKENLTRRKTEIS